MIGNVTVAKRGFRPTKIFSSLRAGFSYAGKLCIKNNKASEIDGMEAVVKGNLLCITWKCRCLQPSVSKPRCHLVSQPHEVVHVKNFNKYHTCNQLGLLALGLRVPVYPFGRRPKIFRILRYQSSRCWLRYLLQLTSDFCYWYDKMIK